MKTKSCPECSRIFGTLKDCVSEHSFWKGEFVCILEQKSFSIQTCIFILGFLKEGYINLIWRLAKDRLLGKNKQKKTGCNDIYLFLIWLPLLTKTLDFINCWTKRFSISELLTGHDDEILERSFFKKLIWYQNIPRIRR